MLFRSNVMVVNQDKRKVGRIPVGVARELINTRAAKVIRNRPAVLELTPSKKTAGRATKPTPDQVEDKPQTKANALKNIVDMASRFATKCKSQHILTSILLKIDNGNLYVEATDTDLESYFSGHIEHNNKYRFSHDEGVSSICISPEKLKKLLPLTEGIVDVHIQKKDDVFGLKIGEFFLEGESTDGFPMIPVPVAEGARFNITNIASKLNFVGCALSTVKARSTLCGVCFDFKNNNLVGADGSRLHFVPLNEDAKLKRVDALTIVPAKILSISKYLTGNMRLVEDKKKEDQSTIFGLDVSGCIQCYAIFKSIEGAYPHYLSVVPVGYKNKFITRTGDLIPALRKAQAYTNDDYRVVCVEFGVETKISAKAYNTTNKNGYNTIVKGNYTGIPCETWVNPTYLLGCIQALPPEEVEITLADENDKGWLIKGQHGFTGIIMPIETP